MPHPRAILTILTGGLLWAGLGLAAPGGIAQEARSGATIIVVRHAEKEQGRDPILSAAGIARSEALADVVAESGVDAIYVTQFRRTRLTAEAVETRSGVVARIVEASRDTEGDARRLAELILAEHRGETVLVVGHSNTVPVIVAALGGVPAGPIPEDDYDNLYVVVVPSSGPVQTLHARYGEPSP